MKTYGGVDVQTHLFLTSALAGAEWSAFSPGRFTAGKRSFGTHWIGGWFGLRTSWRREKFLSYRDSNSDPSVVQPLYVPVLFRNKKLNLRGYNLGMCG
jgi:hypothetical protein